MVRAGRIVRVNGQPAMWEPLPEGAPKFVADFDAAWQRAWPGCVPLGYDLRKTLAPTWVRFHSLLEAKRYPDNEAERGEVLRRHLTVLADLAGREDATLVVVSTGFSQQPSGSPLDVDPTVRQYTSDAAFWRSFVKDNDVSRDPDVWWFHLYLSQATLNSETLAGLLARIAVDDADPVIVAAPDAEWLYHPYDGGADVITPSTRARDRLRQAYSGWLSPLPSGL